MRHALVSLSAVALVATGLLTPTPTAYAASGGSITHYSPDNGYDGPILVHCQGEPTASSRNVYEGRSSDDVCPGHNVDRVFVDTGEEVWCKVFTTFERKWDATGWHSVGDLQNYTCVVHLD